MIENNKEIQKMLENFFSKKIENFEIICANDDKSFDVKITVNSIDVFVVVNCDVSYEKDKLHVVNILFKISNNFKYIYMILDIFNKEISSLTQETLRESFNIFDSTITEISVNLPLERFETFHIDVYGYCTKATSTTWGMGFYDDEVRELFCDSKDLKVIEYLYKISPDVMNDNMQRKYAVYDYNLKNNKTYDEFMETYDSSENDKDLLERYRKLNNKELSSLIDMNKI
jgi:hypothetical protein